MGLRLQNMPVVEFDEKKIDAVFAGLNQSHLPGAVVGIAIDGKPVYRKGFGLASMELPIALTPTTRLRIGSVTKQFTAFAYMLLCEEGKAEIDDPIGKFMPDLHPITHRVTMRQLMGNISGLRDVYEMLTQFSGVVSTVTAADLVPLYRKIDDVNAAPGDTWIYNNGGWEILAATIERITAQSLDDVFRERVFEPIGMYDTSLRRQDTDFVPNCGTQHAMKLSGRFEKSYWMEFAGSGGMISTVDDLLRWMANMDVPRVGGEATWALMKQPQTLSNGTSTGYALGLMSHRYRGIATLEHSGNCPGGNAQLIKIPSAGLDVTVIVNRNDLLSITLAEKILDACLPGLAAVKEPPIAPPISGIYCSPTTGRVVQLFHKDGKQIASIDASDLPVVPNDAGVLVPEGIASSIYKNAVTLVGDPVHPTSILLSHFGDTDELRGVALAEKSTLRSVVGRYRHDSANIEATISQQEDVLRLHTKAGFGSMDFSLENLGEGIYRARPAPGVWGGGILTFNEDGGAFRYSSFQTWSLLFRRSA
jgi:D-aminopeptidase